MISHIMKVKMEKLIHDINLPRWFPW